MSTDSGSTGSEPGAPTADERMPKSELGVRNDQVLLVVPAKPEMWAIVRMTASALAARLDFSFEEVEDLRLAVTELCGTCAVDAEPTAQCECRFELSGNSLELYCRVSPIGSARSDHEEFRLLSTLELSAQILRATVDTHEIKDVEGDVRRGFLSKKHGATR